ncbi:MAG: chemotaxis response regulator protein-glutamate methylesterase [Deltaproteobacteria bacterium]|nr:MAG: chemotaxis response regulator protein-glutamate methylesterase [Deltaproteobacteria bacterium]
MSKFSGNRRIRVLVIDDSAFNRKVIGEMISSDRALELAGTASCGDEGLKKVLELEPDIITLDLEMPRMDGYTFLRLLMNRRPTPVIVISSHSQRHNVFKALELGALDFVAKPVNQLSSDLYCIKDEVLAKLKLVSQLRRHPWSVVAESSKLEQRVAEPQSAPTPSGVAVVAIGASTGGPRAIQHVLQHAAPGACYLVAQHMPAGFTRAFAERLDRMVDLDVVEAKGGERLRPGLVLVAPGGNDLVIVKRGEHLLTRLKQPEPGVNYVPSVDRLFESVARVTGSGCMAVVLTGMGSDGKKGIIEVKNHGGITVAESEDSAVVFGMPKEAMDTGFVDYVASLDELPGIIGEFVARMRKDMGRQDDIA